MSCSGSISPRGRAAIGVMQGQFAGDYPLVDPSDDIKALLADMYLEYDDPASYASGAQEWRYPFSISRLSGAGCLGAAANIEIVDATGRKVFDTFVPAAITRTAVDWSDDYKIYEWRTAAALCRIVVYKTWPATDKEAADNDETTARTYPSTIVPASAVIDPRAVYKIPKRLRSMRVTTAGVTTEKFAGEIAFKNGYNTEIEVGDATITNFRESRRIVFSGVAGSGLGKFYNCVDSDTQISDITTINGTPPAETGDFLIGARGCLWSTHPLPQNNNGQLIKPGAVIKFGGDCAACCSCEDYADAAEYMNQIAYRYQLIGQRAQEVYTQHETNVALWNNNSCAVGEKLAMLIKSQQCGAVDVAITLCNTCSECIPASTLLLELYVPEPEDTYVPIFDPYQYVSGHKNFHGNRIVHEIDCRYTKLTTSAIDRPVAVSGNYETQFGSTHRLITAAGDDDSASISGTVNGFPQIKPKSFVWPTLVTNVFTANTPTTEVIYDPGTYAHTTVCTDPETEQLIFEGPWILNKNDPDWNWRDTDYARTGDALNNYGIRIEDSAILPARFAVGLPAGNNHVLPPLDGYLFLKYLKPEEIEDQYFPTVDWGKVKTDIILTPPGVAPVLVNPATHNRWWSPLTESSHFGDAEVNGREALRVFEMINEGAVSVLFSTASGVLEAMQRVNILPESFDLAPAELVVVGVRADEFETDVVPPAGLHMIDFYGLFSDWRPLNTGVSNYYPAQILAVHTHRPEEPLSDLDDFTTVYFFIKKPAIHIADIQFPAISIDYDFYCTATCYRVRSLAATSFKSVRFYNMNFFTEHILRGRASASRTSIVQPYGITRPTTTDSIESAAETDLIDSPRYSKPDRYIVAQTPRQISIQAPEVPPGATIQIDFRILLSEYSMLDYVTKRTPGDPFAASCGDDHTTEVCSGTELTPYVIPLYDGSPRLQIIPGSWDNRPGVSDIFVIHVPTRVAAGQTAHVNGYSNICVPSFTFPCDPRFVPEYWRVLQWKKLFEDEYDEAEVPEEGKLLADYACPPAVFNGTVEFTPVAGSDPPKVNVKVCGYVYLNGNSKATISTRKIAPRSQHLITAILTGRKPTGSLADLSQQHIIRNDCPGAQESKKEIIYQSIRLKCDGLGRTPEC